MGPAFQHAQGDLSTTELLHHRHQKLPDHTRAWLHEEEWMTSVNVCEWYGITCNENKVPIELKLAKNNIQGQLPLLIGIAMLLGLGKGGVPGFATVATATPLN